ncbi:CHC2 zinc finger domain-containing protein [Myxococcus sp. MxC21-1]|uniref:CHC2 zinc finger domain-containing protein n=1 Tax=Myxococcus sp. MxC21-1 TaxID=3041439 RepID=UPI00292E036E|nr:CHC2 zinc finger domain-containing protein [Myxococcus sp. MxC21-1]WNZ60887.1 CHC2 zinc finger domain-containing protein [Myxococcus sp. MxC21-1]WNZ64004.1 CHC2 zinc finger domain-containing protein [Myxococcus sp. MxC21-1]
MSFRAFVEQVRSRSDITDVVGAHVELRPSGSTLKGLSPFHPEKTPSFVVWPTTQTWRDFSNGGSLGGDVFNFVQEREKVGFKEAVFRLAERAGISPPSPDDESHARELEALVERRDVERLLTAAADYYHRRLPTKLREESFKQHYGFTDEVVDSLKLGWADGGLFEHLSAAVGASREAALKTGLFVQLPGGRVEDFFRERLVFPYWKGAASSTSSPGRRNTRGRRPSTRSSSPIRSGTPTSRPPSATTTSTTRTRHTRPTRC